jgi:hypothetical protein
MAHTYINKSQNADQVATTINVTHTPGAAATVAILSIVIAGTTPRADQSSPTIDGTAATRVDIVRIGAEQLVEVWYVCKTFSGAQFSVSIPNAGGLSCQVEIVTADAGTGYASVYQHASGVVTASNADGGQVDVTSSAAGDFLYARLGCGENAPASITQTSVNPTKTLSYSNDHGSYSSRGDYAVSDGAGTESFIYVWSNDDGCAVAVVFKSAAAPTNFSRAAAGTLGFGTAQQLVRKVVAKRKPEGAV